MRPRRANAVTFPSWVASSPAPPATYDHTSGDIAASALRSHSANVIGKDGCVPVSPSR